ncbi:Hypothetical protein R9X50_00116300 [Acrodontium crateriforme]|uniref:Zn(2)-C6 fungal-type domain-containing protein n=1 Tax=Acrodontium crateriforme TaxID=150365 RepID=A0AAQ3LYY6_9PEZI|nr:Hypothetical protein R9X50_00116300 [Acrodontium crateriforme]
MPEDSATATDRSPQTGRPSSAPTMARKDPMPPQSGFTAVNGDAMRHTSFRPAEEGDAHPPTAPAKKVDHPSPAAQAAQPRTIIEHDPDNITVAGRFRSEHAPPQPEDVESGKKRKREDVPEPTIEGATRTEAPSGTIERPEKGDEPGDSPQKQRRLTHESEQPSTAGHVDHVDQNRPPHDPIAISREIPAPEQGPPDAHRRSESQMTQWNPANGDPLPPPRPETVDVLAESLKRELHGQRDDHPNAELASPEEMSTSPKGDDYRQSGANAYSPDSQHDSQQNAGDDPKKRKRVFSNRTKTGCHTCRSRKKKCDEGKPICQNCERGGFTCGGYGAKPPQGFKPSVVNNRAPIALQSKPPYEPSHGPTGYYPQHEDPYGHWRGMPPPHGASPDLHHRPPSGPDPRPPPPPMWQPRPGWPSVEQQLPPIPPMYGARPPSEHHLPPPHAPPPPQWQHAPPPHPPPPSLPPPNNFRQSTGTVGGHGSEHGSSNSGSHQVGQAVMTYLNGYVNHLSEKDKMLLGFPYMGHLDETLINDRQSCKMAVERWLDAARANNHHSNEEQGRFFRAIVDPTFRHSYYPPTTMHREQYTGPKGHVGTSTMVDAPFFCEYGYNIHLGSDVILYRNCEMYDSCEIRIGNRTIVGPNVKFYTTTAPMDPHERRGSRSKIHGGSISVGEDCFIGADVIILPYRKIGRGAVIGAGSVVTKDVKENTVVAGNPARYIRTVEPGPNVERHRPDIQEQNERVLDEMRKMARKGYDR